MREGSTQNSGHSQIFLKEAELIKYPPKNALSIFGLGPQPLSLSLKVSSIPQLHLVVWPLGMRAAPPQIYSGAGQGRTSSFTPLPNNTTHLLAVSYRKVQNNIKWPFLLKGHAKIVQMHTVGMLTPFLIVLHIFSDYYFWRIF